MVLCLFFQLFSLQEPVTSSSRYCIIASGDGRVIASSNGDAVQSVASISKIMTAMIAIEEGNLEEKWNVSKDIVQHAIGSSVYLKPKQSVTLQSLLYGLLLRSGNDAAYEIAVHIAGSEAKFVKLMNAKADAIGMRNTVFTNASGLDEDGVGNRSTACDMAVLMQYALKNDQFRKIIATKYYTTEWKIRWKNKNRLLFTFPFLTGGKTGYTKQAGRTLITSARKGALESIVVTLNMQDDFAFHQMKHTEVLNAYQSEMILKKGIYYFGNQQATLHENVYFTRQKEELLPQISLYLKDNELILESADPGKFLQTWKLEKRRKQ